LFFRQLAIFYTQLTHDTV